MSFPIEILLLPLYSELTEEMAEYVTKVIRK